MQLRVPTCYLLALLVALLARPGGAALVLPGSFKLYVAARDDDGDDDDSDGDDSDSDDNNGQANHRGAAAASATPASRHAVSKGAVAGIVVGCLLLLLLLILLGCWCVRRRRTSSKQKAKTAARRAAAVPEMKEHSSTPLLVHNPPNLRPGSIPAPSPTGPVPGPLYFSDSTGRRGTEDFRDIAPGTYDTTPFPNPYDGDTPPQPPPRDDLLSSLTSSPTSPYLASNPSRTSHRQSTAPSSWTHDEGSAALLARGGSQTSRLTASSSLHEEMAGYQKALEAHHRKESEDAAVRENRFGEGSSVPADPPPQYSPSREA